MCSQDFNSKINWLVVLMTSLRLICAAFVELGNDEVYYYTYAVQSDWNHFDHPPIVGILIRFFTLNLHCVNDISMRLGAIIGAGISTWLIAHIGLLIRNERTGFIAAILYNASIYTGIVAGLFILPDSPAVVFWLAAIYTFFKAIRSDNPKRTYRFLIWTGIWIGLATMSKVHGCFLGLGMVGYMLFNNQKLFRSMGFYLGLMFAALLCLPILAWNMHYDFITWRFHGERVDVSGFHVDFRSFGVAVFGQIVYYHPLITILSILAMWDRWSKKTVYVDKGDFSLLLWCALPIILVTTLVSLFKPILPHWSGPGFIPLMLLTAAWVDERLAVNKSSCGVRSIMNVLLYFTMFVMVAAVLLIRFFPGTIGQKGERDLGRGDFTLDMYGWRSFADEFARIRGKDEITPLIIDKWFPGGHLYYYLADPLHMRLVAAGRLHDLHKFAWLMRGQQLVSPGENAYYITPSNYFNDPSLTYKESFAHIDLVAKIPEKRAGALTRYWYVYKLIGAKKVIGTSIEHY